MHVGTLAGTARDLEETSSRTALVALLAELFAAATPEEIALDVSELRIRGGRQPAGRVPFSFEKV